MMDVLMGSASFLLGFLAVGLIGVVTIPSFEPLPSERIGATGFLLLLCLAASTISTLSHSVGCLKLHRRSGWLMGLLGGVVAAGTFCAAGSAGFAGLVPQYPALLFMLFLPGLSGWVWSLLAATDPELHQSN
jgi:hypothetical protein